MSLDDRLNGSFRLFMLTADADSIIMKLCLNEAEAMFEAFMFGAEGC